MTWTDITSYSQGDKIREPLSWQKRAGPMRIVVTRTVHKPGKWVTRLYHGAEIFEFEAGNVGEDIDAVRTRGLENCAKFLRDLAGQVEKLL